MADKRQPQGRSQGKDNKTSRPVTGSDSDSQSLHSNEATYGSDDDDTALENASVSHTDDMSQTVPDDDPEIMQRYKREIAEILTNWANESGEAERLGELMEDTLSWIANTVVYYGYIVQGGPSTQTWGEISSLRPEPFESWEARNETVVDILKCSRRISLQLIREVDQIAPLLAAQPRKISKGLADALASNEDKKDHIAAGKEEQPREPPTTQTTPAASGNARGQGARNSLGSSRAQVATGGGQQQYVSRAQGATGVARQQYPSTSSATAMKQNLSSAAPRTPAQGGVSMPPTPSFSSNGPNALLATQGGINISAASSFHGPVNQPGQRTRPGPVGNGIRNVPQPASGGRAVPSTLVLHGVPPLRQGVVPPRAGASSTGPPLPARDNAGLRASPANMHKVFGVAPKVSPNSSGETSGQNPQPKPNPSAADRSTVKPDARPANAQFPSFELRLQTRDDATRANARQMAVLFLKAARQATELIEGDSHNAKPNPKPGVAEQSTIRLELRLADSQPARPAPPEGSSSGVNQPNGQCPCGLNASLPTLIKSLGVVLEFLQPESSRGGQSTGGPGNKGISPANNQPVGYSPRVPGVQPPVSEEVLSAARALMQLRYSGGSNNEGASSGDPGARSMTLKRPREASPSVGERRPRIPHHVMVAAQQKELDICNARVGQGPRTSEHEGEGRASKRQKREKRKDKDPKEDEE